MNPKISIIVPIYNSERYLKRCIDSILIQNYKNFELLLIDDGSLDASGAICDEYAVIDMRVRVYHKENGGVSSARNMGIDLSRGEWLSFVDSDDWIVPNFLEQMALNLDADIVKCSVSCTSGDLWRTENSLCEVKDFIKEYETNSLIRTSCGTLFRADIIKNEKIKFDTSIRFGEDMMFNLQYMICCKLIRLTDFIGYNYWSAPCLYPSAKYRLSFEEIKEAIEKTISLKEKLANRFHITISADYDFLMYLTMVPLNGMANPTYLEAYFQLCKEFIPSLTYESFYNNSLYSPIVRGIQELKRYYEMNVYSKANELYYTLNKIADSIVFKIQFKNKDAYLWWYLIKNGNYNVMDLMMKTYFIIKRIKTKVVKTDKY